MHEGRRSLSARWRNYSREFRAVTPVKAGGQKSRAERWIETLDSSFRQNDESGPQVRDQSYTVCHKQWLGLGGEGILPAISSQAG